MRALQTHRTIEPGPCVHHQPLHNTCSGKKGSTSKQNPKRQRATCDGGDDGWATIRLKKTKSPTTGKYQLSVIRVRTASPAASTSSNSASARTGAAGGHPAGESAAKAEADDEKQKEEEEGGPVWEEEWDEEEPHCICRKPWMYEAQSHTRRCTRRHSLPRECDFEHTLPHSHGLAQQQRAACSRYSRTNPLTHS